MRVLHHGDEPPFVFDLGTGLRYFGAGWPADRPFRGTALLTHLHWDHVQGLPFFAPLLRDGVRLDVYAPVQDDGRSVRDAFDFFMRPPYFPVTMEALCGTVNFTDVGEDEISIGGARVLARLVPHVGPTLGFRVTCDDVSVAYLSDHQQPWDAGFEVSSGGAGACAKERISSSTTRSTRPPSSLARTRGATAPSSSPCGWPTRPGAERLVLFHHDPLRDDDSLDELARETKELAACLDLEVMVASEGLTVSL